MSRTGIFQMAAQNTMLVHPNTIVDFPSNLNVITTNSLGMLLIGKKTASEVFSIAITQQQRILQVTIA